MNNNFFTFRDKIEGKVAIGKIPDNLKPILDDISDLYDKQIPNKEASTYHTWYDDMPISIKSKVEEIQKNNFL